MRTCRLILLFACLACACLSQAWAGHSPPVPEKKTVSLETLNKKLNEEKERGATLARESRARQADMEQTKSDLVALASSMRTNEMALQGLETRIATMQKEQADLRERMQHDYGSVADLILALERMRRVPPEALMVRPETPLKTAQSALILQEVLPDVYGRAQGLRADLDRLAALARGLQDDRAAQLEQARNLDAQRKDMESLLKKRESLFRNTEEARKSQAAETARLAAQAQSMQELVDRIDEDRKRQEAHEEAIPSRPKETTVASLPPLPGNEQARLPVSGSIRIRYGQPDDLGAPSQGITIDGRAGSVVVAPVGGVVRFSGPFKRFGNIVIIEHKNGYHSLIAGLDRIDTVTGQKIDAGEPVGVLSPPAQGGNSALYYELRLNGKPVNPTKLFAELG